MEIEINDKGEVEYRYDANMDDEIVDIASDALDIMREFIGPNQTGQCILRLMDELDLTYGEAREMVQCPTSEFEYFVSGLFTLTEQDNEVIKVKKKKSPKFK